LPFFDATYGMAKLGMGFHGIIPANADAKKKDDDAKLTHSLTTLDIGLYGKYPISLGAVSLFPLLGVDFKIALAQDTTIDGKTKSYADTHNDHSVGEYMTTVWLKFGVGADIPLTEKLYVRPMFLYGFGTLPKDTKETMDKYNKSKHMVDIIYHGLDVNVAVGYKL